MVNAVKDFYDFLDVETKRLLKIRDFIATIPDRITRGEITTIEFQNFVETYELETYKFHNTKQDHIKKVTESLNIPAEELSFQLLVKMGYTDFIKLAPEFIAITDQIKSMLLKTSIFIKNFMRLNQELMKLNNYLLQNDYSRQGREKSDHHSYSFYREA